MADIVRLAALYSLPPKGTATAAQVEKAVADGILEKMLFFPTPTGRPSSDIKAPQRLVTNTSIVLEAVRDAPAQGTLAVPKAVSGLDDPYWQTLLQALDDADAQQPATGFEAAFAPATLQTHSAAMPAFIVSALVSGFERGMACVALRTSFVACLKHTLGVLLKEVPPVAPPAGEALWAQPRTGPAPASLAELLSHPSLLPALAACLAGAEECAGAATDALHILSKLTLCPEGQDMVKRMHAINPEMVVAVRAGVATARLSDLGDLARARVESVRTALKAACKDV